MHNCVLLTFTGITFAEWSKQEVTSPLLSSKLYILYRAWWIVYFKWFLKDNCSKISGDISNDTLSDIPSAKWAHNCWMSIYLHEVCWRHPAELIICWAGVLCKHERQKKKRFENTFSHHNMLYLHVLCIKIDRGISPKNSPTFSFFVNIDATTVF